MNFGLNDDQQMLRDTFIRFLDSESSTARVRAAQQAGGLDAKLWQGLAELGTFAIRVPEAAGGLGMGTLDAALVMEEAGRTLVSGPLAEALVTLAFHDLATHPVQWLSGGAHADVVVARSGSDVVLITPSATDRHVEDNIAANGIGEVDLAQAPRQVLASGQVAVDLLAQAIEEWKLLAAAGLNGLAREAVRLAAAYACERHAFGVPIGTFQAMSHPLANIFTDIEGGKYLIWKVIHEISEDEPGAGGHIPLALWWNARAASQAGIQALRTFGGYGLATES